MSIKKISSISMSLICLIISSCDISGNGIDTISISSINLEQVSDTIYTKTIDLDYTITYSDGSVESSTKTFTASEPGTNSFNVTENGVESNSVSIDFEDWRLILPDGSCWSYDSDADGAGDNAEPAYIFKADGTCERHGFGNDGTFTDNVVSFYGTWDTTSDSEGRHIRTVGWITKEGWDSNFDGYLYKFDEAETIWSVCSLSGSFITQTEVSTGE